LKTLPYKGMAKVTAQVSVAEGVAVVKAGQVDLCCHDAVMRECDHMKRHKQSQLQLMEEPAPYLASNPILS
jgi:hypothetical protein